MTVAISPNPSEPLQILIYKPNDTSGQQQIDVNIVAKYQPGEAFPDLPTPTIMVEALSVIAPAGYVRLKLIAWQLKHYQKNADLATSGLHRCPNLESSTSTISVASHQVEELIHVRVDARN